MEIGGNREKPPIVSVEAVGGLKPGRNESALRSDGHWADGCVEVQTSDVENGEEFIANWNLMFVKKTSEHGTRVKFFHW